MNPEQDILAGLVDDVAKALSRINGGWTGFAGNEALARAAIDVVRPAVEEELKCLRQVVKDYDERHDDDQFVIESENARANKWAEEAAKMGTRLFAAETELRTAEQKLKFSEVRISELHTISSELREEGSKLASVAIEARDVERILTEGIPLCMCGNFKRQTAAFAVQAYQDAEARIEELREVLAEYIDDVEHDDPDCSLDDCCTCPNIARLNRVMRTSEQRRAAELRGERPRKTAIDVTDKNAKPFFDFGSKP